MSTATIKRYTKDAGISEIIDALEDDGCVVIENVLNSEELHLLQEDLRKSFSKTENCAGEFYGFATKRLGSLFSKSQICQSMAIKPFILEIMGAFLLKGCEQYQINLTQGIAIAPGEDAQIIHQDDPMFPFLHPGYEAMINCMWAVDDFTVDNGATYVVPGSHKWARKLVIDPETMRLPQPHEIAQGTMKAGSVLIYFGSLYHGGGQNTSETVRRGAVISYSLGWLRQAENNYLTYSLEEVASMPERLQRLLGYFVHAPNLGSIEGQDPIDLVRGLNVSHKQFQEFIPEEAKQLIRQFKKMPKAA